MPKRPLDDVVLVIRGTVIDSPELTTLRVRTHAVLGVRAIGTVAFCEEGHTEPLSPGSSLVLREGGEVVLSRGCVIRDLPARGFLCPGLVDTHTHAPQFSFTGIGRGSLRQRVEWPDEYDLQLLDWLNKYTFPSEAKFKDSAFAARVCRNAVARTLRNGTTSCMYFATIHTDAALQLGRIASGMGQRAFVIPPRFVPTGSSELMEGLAPIAPRPQLLESYASCYDYPGLLGRRTVLAHGVYLGERDAPPRRFRDASETLPQRHSQRHYLGEPNTPPLPSRAEGSRAATSPSSESERALLKSRGASVSHCPLSNMMLRSGMLNALKVSNLVSLAEGRPGGGMWEPLSFTEAFHLATAAGARSLGVDGLTGDFSTGSLFDAVVVDPEAPASPFELYEGDGALASFEKWMQLGDDRNTAEVYVQGSRVFALKEGLWTSR
ncbi:hypothetical protein EMIHUDRAFT_469266 [Emiliania huxleyi CCMP1516]|uniref:Amidohydrolase-related domain-containing protein n=2 Tax=Emiliania huxleyi TaxID=2903 RepID=A0A0D3JN20_EMIH1|nr:hypothetical protein EMIHUDRAFT_469266 [Emiliania huxleyi CCMP1516]EOD24905.1 hypothetical protein EMIHUDRAFT_469266 [Emiliania huxleyi CCMP1516]|eukprot:XP_005777334.1 hypothetical protein EMIHUDRAFT_469266 [Emiliania huxleyi CCMP1516]